MEHNLYAQSAAARCGFVVTDEARYGAVRFCDAPALPGSSYCAGHRALCQVPPRSRAAARIHADHARAASDGAAPPLHLAALPVPEPFEAADDGDARALVDAMASTAAIHHRDEEE